VSIPTKKSLETLVLNGGIWLDADSTNLLTRSATPPFNPLGFSFATDTYDVNASNSNVFGLHHITRPEDWPIMPADTISFWLKPFGFFDQNPSIDVAPSDTAEGAHCHTGVDDEHGKIPH